MVRVLLLVGGCGMLGGPFQMLTDRSREKSIAWYYRHPSSYFKAGLWGQESVWKFEACMRLGLGYLGIASLASAGILVATGVPLR